ncbi:glycosyltransferase [Cetobacterium sp.]|uniref:glycosyltransferase n=1 Tax=Cetobacterium sp. TaxID=2071632 RepID=UPI003F3E2DE6
MKKPIIIFSGINLNEGGTLSIMRDCLRYASTNLSSEYELIALVHKKSLFQDIDKIKYLEFEDSKKSYLKRMYYEYFYFKKLSKELNPYLWFSLHDMTPNVKANIRAVYCHNPMPFYKMNKLEKKLEPKLNLFSLFYKYLYKINIKKNNYVIVQQNWIKEKFQEMYKISNVVVSYPNIDLQSIKYKKIETKDNKIRFFYPAISRVFKNFEVICEAAESLEKKGINNLEFILTIEKGINEYGDYIYEKYNHIKSIKFVGKLSREEVFSYYDYSNVLIFPSKLETWGLPISEFKEFNKPILLSDLPYARETVGSYKNIRYFNPSSPYELEQKINDSLNNKVINIEDSYKELNVEMGWKELMIKLLKKNSK